MKLGVILFILCSLHVAQPAEGVMQKFLDKIIQSIIDNLVKLIATCTTDHEASKVQYWLYTSEKSEKLIENITVIDPNQRVIIILHGHAGNKDVEYITAIKDAYIEHYDNVNVIVPDYGSYVDIDYPSSSCNLPYIGKNIAKFVCQLTKELQINATDIHIIGHGLGGQLAGLVGLYVKDACEVIGRITGLDPAGPLYQFADIDNRLDKTDAAFVDVIHTNRGQMGYEGSLGDVDFYPNNGGRQPKCEYLLNDLSISNIFTVARNFVICNHESAAFYFAESITLNSFYAHSAILCNLVCIEDIFHADTVYMGEYLKCPPKSQAYVLTTNEDSPYGKGPDGPLE